MTYPYPELIPLLKFQTTPAEYLEALAHKKATRDESHFHSLLPVYRHAICPICQTECTEALDTYSLHLNQIKFPLDDNMRPGYPEGYNPPCPHYFGVQRFLNLHDQQLPDRITSLTFPYGEVPGLSPWFVPLDVESYAVLHALPICEIIDGVFVPRYTCFYLSYFNVAMRLLLERAWDQQREAAESDDRYYAYTMAQPMKKSKIGPVYDDLTRNFPLYMASFAQHYDLGHWATQGKLAWLNPQTLELEKGPEKTLPVIYQHIKGRPYFMQWRQGQLKPW